MNPPTNEELLLWLRDPEHSFVERKVFSDTKDWLKTVVAFANSTPIGYPAVLYIGVRDDCEPEGTSLDLDRFQRNLSERLTAAYPVIYYETKILDVGGKKVLAVVVPGSPNRPHFGGPAYVREGSKTVNASKEQFDQLVAQRNSKAYWIMQYVGKPISHVQIANNQTRPGTTPMQLNVLDCNQFYVILEGNNFKLVLPLARVTISFDVTHNRLQLEEHP